MPRLLSAYNAASLFYFALVGYIVVFGNLAFGICVTLLTFALLFVPTVSFDYKLIHLLIPIGLFMRNGWNDDSGRKLSRGANIALAITLGMLISPKDWYTIRPDQTINVIFNAVLLLCASIFLVFKAEWSIHFTKGWFTSAIASIKNK